MPDPIQKIDTDPSLESGGYVAGTSGDDIFNLISTNGTNQFHPYGKKGADTFNMIFSGITTFSHGHHIYSEDIKKPEENDPVKFFDAFTFKSDTFDFKDVDQVGSNAIIVGRLDHFEGGVERDVIKIEGLELDLNNPSAFVHANVASVKIVLFNGAHTDPSDEPQQWLLITTITGGIIFYALEGARVDTLDLIIDRDQERHFLLEADLPPNFSTMPSVPYVNPNDKIPDGYIVESGGVTYNDRDGNITDVENIIGDNIATDLYVEATSFGDLIAGGLNDDTIWALGGNDRVWGGSGDDTIYGHSGHDLIFGGRGNDEIYGGDDNDVLRGENGNDLIEGGSGNDWLLGGNGNDTLNGGTGTDNLRGNDGHDTLNGDGGDDDLRGANGDDILYGGDGNDILYGGTDTDQLFGGDGNDVLRGENGHDLIEGGNGVDWLIGGNGNDTLLGGADRDYLRGEAGNDTLSGGDGDDDLRGGVGDDNLYGGAGNDTMRGGSNTDRMFGSVGDDNLSGENGNDTLYGENGTDILSGGNGNDTLRGGRGNDTLTGDGGNDRFVFDVDSGADTITDFSVAGAETLDFSNIASITSMGNLAISYGATDTVITFSGGSVTLEDTTGVLLVNGDFIF